MNAPRPLSDLIPLVLADAQSRRESAGVTSLFPLRLVDLSAERTRPRPAEQKGSPDAAWERIGSRAA
jgi:hypothetical protein